MEPSLPEKSDYSFLKEQIENESFAKIQSQFQNTIKEKSTGEMSEEERLEYYKKYMPK